MQHAKQTQRTRELTGRHVLLMLVAFFGVTVAVNTIFITKAVSSFTGEDVKGSYRQGLEYNKTIESRSAQAALGWRVTTNFLQPSRAEQRLVIRITEQNDRPVTGLSIEGLFKRPTDLAKDKEAQFSERGEGIYEVRTDLTKGQWTLKATAMGAGETLRFEDRFVVP